MNGRSSMFPTHGEEIRNDSRTANRSSDSHPDPRASVDDYNRVMLQYTQRQMAAFTNANPSRRNNSVGSGSSGSSCGSSSGGGNSNRSDSSVMSTLARKPSGAGPPRGRRSPPRGWGNRHQNDAEGVPSQ